MDTKWTTLTVTTVGVLMVSLDSRIVVVGLPQVAAALRADAEQAIWFTQSYLLTGTVFVLGVGRLSDLIGKVKLYIAGFALFTAMSALITLAQDPIQMIALRGVQGLGTAIIYTTSTALITDATPRNELGFAMGFNSLAIRFGSMAGLTVSGVILSFFDWRALFYINIPIGIFGIFWAYRRLKELTKPEGSSRMDWVGFVTFTCAITALLLSMTFAAYGLAQDAMTLYALLIVAVVGFSIFALNERRVKHPVLDFSLFRIREVTGGAIALVLNTFSWGAALIVISLYLQLVRNFTPLSAGLAILPFELGNLAVGPLSGRLSDKYGYLPFTTVGLVLVSGALFLLSASTSATPFPLVEACFILLGAGIGCFGSPNTASIMRPIPPMRRGVASGIRSIFYSVGTTLSLNAVILIMTVGMPYGIVTSVISSGQVAVPPAYTAAFEQGIKSVFFWFGATNSIALIPSVFRDRRVTQRVKFSASAGAKK